ncbi:MAG TPA: LysE family transporter, partial [Stellaceae bacterium]|nr:LysE family transporter [Stellaceae bacterium]
VRTPLQALGGAALIWLGIGFMRAKPAAERAAGGAAGLAAAYGVTLFLTLTNPATILSFAAVMASLGAIGASGRTVALVAGVFLGSALW